MGLARYGSVTADGAIVATAAKCRAFYLTPDGTNAARCIFYDSADGSGSPVVLAELRCTGTRSAKLELHDHPIQAELGIYADVTTAGACRAGAVFE